MKLIRRRNDEAKVAMAPMIDMVFLLLIFFMVTSRITKEKKKMDIQLPESTVALVPEDFSGREIVNIDAEGRYFVGNSEVDLKGLKAYLKQRLIDYPPLQVSIRADSKTPAKRIKEIMQACSHAGAIEVIFANHKIKQ